MKYEIALQIAETLVKEMRPWCERILIAGSLRRKKTDVKDVEVLAITKVATTCPKQLKTTSTVRKPNDDRKQKELDNYFPYRNLPSQWELFGDDDDKKDDTPKDDGKLHNLLWLWGNRQSIVRWIKPSVPGLQTWIIKPDGKYWRGVIESDQHSPIKVDIFLMKRENWGVISAIRTGPADFSAALVTVIKNKTPFRVHEGNLMEKETGKIINCYEEEDFFKNAGIVFVPVEDRENNPYQVIKKIYGKSNCY